MNSFGDLITVDNYYTKNEERDLLIMSLLDKKFTYNLDNVNFINIIHELYI